MIEEPPASEDEIADELVVVVVDDETAYCDLMADFLNNEPGLTCGGVALTPNDARSVVTEAQPDVLLFDGVRFHERQIEPLELAAELMAINPSMHMLIWTSWTDHDPSQLTSMQFRMAAIRAGAKDLLSKGSALTDILDAIRKSVITPPGVPNPTLWPDIQPRIPDDDWATADLTPTQARWASILAQSFKVGMTVQEVAQQHRAKAGNLRSYVQQIHRAWNISNQVQLVMEAEYRGLATKERRDSQPHKTIRRDSIGAPVPTAVLTCMDARLEDMRGLGDLQVNTTHIVRNAGGRASYDALRSLAASCVVSARRILVVHHTDCAMAQIDDEGLKRRLPDRQAARDIEFMTIQDPDSALREDVERVARSALLPPGIEVVGLMYDVHEHAAHTVVSDRVSPSAARPVAL